MGALQQLVEEQAAGNPAGCQKRARHGVAYLAARLQGQGFDISATTVYRLLGDLGYAPRANRKRFTGPPRPDRDRQFDYIRRQRRRFAIPGHPTISVDSKKKELIGHFKNPGRRRGLAAEQVNAHDFLDDAPGRAAPYGLYDVRGQRGHVYVGLSADTAAFAADAIARWWRDDGRRWCPEADEWLILCDAGGSNSRRARLWKQQLQEKLADRWGLRVAVCHYPRGASKRGPVEHRLFSRVSINWAGQPLRTVETLLACIRGTTTEAGSAVTATVLGGAYKRGIKVPDAEVATWRLQRHAVCPDWNYTIKPRWTTF